LPQAAIQEFSFSTPKRERNDVDYAKTETGGIASLVALLSRLAEVPLTDVCGSADEHPRTERSTAPTVRPLTA
jgi:hypothetical protein